MREAMIHAGQSNALRIIGKLDRDTIKTQIKGLRIRDRAFWYIWKTRLR